MSNRASRSRRIYMATPRGWRQPGGVDRLTDLIVDEVETAPARGFRVVRLVTRGPSSIVFSPFYFAFALVRLCVDAAFGRVDLLHLHLSVRGSTYRKLVMAAVARRFRIPYILHLHGATFHEYWPGAGDRLRRAIDHLFAESEAVIVLGSFWRDVVLARLPQLGHKISVLANATPRSTAPAQAHSDKVRIVFLGELGPRKGSRLLVDALARLVDNFDWNATLAGNGEVEATRSLVSARGLAERIAVPGWLNAEEASALLSDADIFVLPSFAENLPMSVLEACGAGAAIVATPVGAVSDVIENQRNGLIVPVGDVQALSEAIRCLVENAGLRRKFGDAARADHARLYEIGPYVKQLVAIWERATPLKAPPAETSQRILDGA